MAAIAVDRLKLRLFGSPLLLCGNEVVALGRRARGLLGYLALSNPPRATRERLTGLFWPDRAEAQARASLRQCLVELRGALGTAVQADREWVALEAENLAGDWAGLDDAIDSQDAAMLAATIADIGSQPLLDGMDFGEGFDDWLRSTRAALEGRLAAAVLQRVIQAGEAGEVIAALALADAWTARDPLDEAVTIAAIRVEMAQNAAVAARKRYRNLEKALERHGVGEPGHLMRAALEAAPAPAVSRAISPALGSVLGSAAMVGGAPSGKPSIAVMLFRHPGGDADQAYFAEGMSDDIIAGLARSRMMRVTSRQSSLSLAAQDANSLSVCSDLGVRYLVRGQVRRLGPAMRVSVELTDGAHDETIWAGRYDRPIADLFSVQDEITTAIVATIEPALLGQEQKLAVESNRGLDHWDLLMRGRYHFWRATRDDLATANDLLLKALALAPDDAATLALLAMTELGEVWAGTRGDVMGILRRAHDYAMRAVAADPRDSAAHHAIGIVLSFMGQSEQAAAEQRLALELNPTSAPARGELGRLLAFRGEAEEALASADEAIRLSPTDPHVWLWYRSKAIACFCVGRYEEAVAHALDSCARRPDYFFLHFLVAACHGANGNAEAARAACAQGLLIHPKYSLRALVLGHPFARAADLDTYVGALRAAGWEG
jgi:TolB-like protein